MPRKIYEPSEKLAAIKEKEMESRDLFGSCLKAEGVSDRNINALVQAAADGNLDGLDILIDKQEVWVVMDQFRGWIQTPDGQFLAYPKKRKKKTAVRASKRDALDEFRPPIVSVGGL